MRKLFILLALVAGLTTQAHADFTGKDASAVTQTWFDFTCFTTKRCPAHVIIKSDGTEIFTSGNPGQVLVTNTLAAVANNADDIAGGAGAASPVVSYNYVWDAVGGNWDRQVKTTSVANACEVNAQSYAPILMTTATTLQVVAASASNKTYICSLFLKASAADNVALVEGTGGSCVTGIAGVIGGTTTANGFVFGTAGDGVLLQSGGKTAVAQTAGTNVGLCLITSTTGPLIGGIKYVQAP